MNFHILVSYVTFLILLVDIRWEWLHMSLETIILHSENTSADRDELCFTRRTVGQTEWPEGGFVLSCEVRCPHDNSYELDDVFASGRWEIIELPSNYPPVNIEKNMENHHL